MVAPIWQSRMWGTRVLQVLMALSFVCSGVAPANPMDTVRVSGFASLGAGRINRDQWTFEEYTDQWSFTTDSILGGQVQVDLPRHWTATAQVVLRGFDYGDNNEYQPTVEWLFASYQLSPTVRLRLGRLQTPQYNYSDSLEVGYSYLWVRPPVDTYSFLNSAIRTLDGVDIQFDIDVGDAEIDIQVYAGEMEGEGQIGLPLTFSAEALGVVFSSHLNNLTLRYGVTLARSDVRIGFIETFILQYNSYIELDPIFSEIKNAHGYENDLFQYHGVGLQWDYNGWRIDSEAFLTHAPNVVNAAQTSGWSTTLSKQVKQYTPYIALGYFHADASDDLRNLIETSRSRVPEGQIAALDLLRNIDEPILEFIALQGRSYTAGIRMDVFSSAAIKVEVQYFDSTALLKLNVPGLQSERDTLLTSLSLDAVF